jgi:hypothetical protein
MAQTFMRKALSRFELHPAMTKAIATAAEKLGNLLHDHVGVGRKG